MTGILRRAELTFSALFFFTAIQSFTSFIPKELPGAEGREVVCMKQYNKNHAQLSHNEANR